MKLLVIVSALLASQVSAFTASLPSIRQRSTTSSALNLFGGGGGGGGDKKGPGMMDQLAMLKKAQEVATKKKKLDDELAKMEFVGESEGGKVKAHLKYVPSTNPMDPNPDYEVVSFDFDDDFYESSEPSDIAASVKVAIEEGVKTTNEAVVEKYSTLQADVMEAFKGGAPGSS